MTISLTEAEMAVLERLCGKKDLSKTALVCQALWLYTSVDEHLARGGQIFVESADKAEKAELLVL